MYIYTCTHIIVYKLTAASTQRRRLLTMTQVASHACNSCSDYSVAWPKALRAPCDSLILYHWPSVQDRIPYHIASEHPSCDILHEESAKGLCGSARARVKKSTCVARVDTDRQLCQRSAVPRLSRVFTLILIRPEHPAT